MYKQILLVIIIQVGLLKYYILTRTFKFEIQHFFILDTLVKLMAWLGT